MKPHSKPISAENANFISEMDGIIAGLRAGSPTMIDQCLNKINYMYEFLIKAGKFPPVIDKSLDYLYIDFLPQVIPLLMKMISPGSIAILSINIVLFVSYKMEHGDPSYTKLINLFFENQFLLDSFKNMERSEANQYNKTISGSVSSYAANPGQCQFVINPPLQGVDFISITIQNCARRLMFTYLLTNLKSLKSFEGFSDVAKMFEYCSDNLHPNFRKFLFDFIEKNIIKKSNHDDRFNSPSSLFIHRMLFLIAIDSRMRRPNSELYFTAITKFFLNGYTEQPLYEVRLIMRKIHKPEAKIIAFISSFLEVLFHEYKDEYNELIKEIVDYLKSNSKLEKELICTALIGKWDLFVKLFNIFEDSFNYELIYNKLKNEPELTPSMANSLLLSIPNLSGKIDETSEILRAMKFSDESSIPFLSKLSDLDDTQRLVEAINEIIDRKEIQKPVTATIICKLAKGNNLKIDFPNLSNLIINLMKGKELLTIFNEYEFLMVLDLPLFVHRVGNEEDLLRFLRDHFVTQIYLVEKEVSSFNPSQKLIKLLFDSFILSNEIENDLIPHESDRKLKYFSLIYDALVLSSKKFRDSYERIRPFVQNIVVKQPSLVVNYIVNEINYNADFHKKLLAIQCLNFSKVPSEIILNKIGRLNDKNLYPLFLFRKMLNETKPLSCDEENIKALYDVLRGYLVDAQKNWMELIKYENKCPLLKAVAITILLRLHFKSTKTDDPDSYDIRSQEITTRGQEFMNLAIDTQFYPLLSTMIKNTEIPINPRKVTNLPFFFYKKLFNTLINRDSTDIYGLAAALKFSDSQNIPLVMRKINEKPEKEVLKISTQIIAEYQRIDKSEILEAALKCLPKSINKYLILTFFFSPQLCPLLRTKNVIQTFFSLFYEDTVQILKFYDTNKCASISYDRCGFEDNSGNFHASTIFQVFSSFLPLFEKYHTIENKFMNVLKLLEFGDLPFYSGSLDDGFFESEHDAAESWEHVISTLLTDEQKKLFEFELNHTIQHTVFLPSSTKSINRFMDENGAKFTELPTIMCFKFEKTVNLDVIEPIISFKAPNLNLKIEEEEEVESEVPFEYNFQAAVYYDNDEFMSIIKNGAGNLVQCRDKFCEFVGTIKPQNVYMLIYQKADKSINYIDSPKVWNMFSETEKKTIAPISLSATKAINSTSIDWTKFKLDHNYLRLSILLFRKYDVKMPLEVLSITENFSEYVYHIVFEENDFQFFFDAPEMFTHVMMMYPDRQKLIKTLVQFSGDDQHLCCALCLLFSIQMTSKEAFEVLKRFDDKVLTHATAVPSFPNFFFHALRSNPDRKDVLNLLKSDSVKSTILPLDDYSLIPFLIPITDNVLRAVISYSSKQFVTELLRQAKQAQNNSEQK